MSINALAFLSSDWVVGNIVYDILKAVGIAALVMFLRWLNGGRKLSRARHWAFGTATLGLALFVVSGWRSIVNANRAHGASRDAMFRVVGGSLGFVEGNSNQIPWIACSMEIYNVGSQPSIIRDWNLQVTIPNLPPIQAKTMIINGQTPNFEGQTPPEVHMGDYLLPKTGTSPVGPGAGVKGYLIFHLPEIQPKEYMVPGTLFRVSFRDVNDVVYTCDYTTTASMKRFP